MKVLVTGGSGFLGSHVAEQLSKGGHEVRALVRKSSNRKFLSTLSNLEFAEGSVEDARAVEEAVKGVDAIVHSAGLVKARGDAEFYQTNVQGTINLAAAAKEHAPKLKRFVHVSSLEVSGPSADGIPVLVTQESPITRYGRSKLEAERALLREKDALPITILRPTGIYGPRDNEILEVFRTVKRGALPITGDGRSKVTFTYGPDCAAACVRAIEADVPSGSTYFITDGEIYEQRAAMEEVERAMGSRAFVRFGLPASLIRTVAIGVEAYGKIRGQAVMLTREKADALSRPYWVCSSEQAEKDLGWKPAVKWAEGARLTAAWYKENGWL